MTGRPVLAVPARRGKTTEIVLHGAPVAMGASVVLGWDASHRAITVCVATARPEWVEDLLQALVEARHAAEREVRP